MGRRGNRPRRGLPGNTGLAWEARPTLDRRHIAACLDPRQLEHHPDLQAFREEILGALLSYEGSGDYIKTLEVYFEHNGNQSQAAEALFIHWNTLIYRMERISEITGLDLDHTETRLAVQLALRIHRMLEREQ